MKYNKELKIGIFAVSVLVISFFLINYLRGKDIFNKEIELKARYENIEGLTASAPVFIKGYKAGKVTEVKYDTQSGNFEVTCSIMKEFRIPADSRIVIYGVDIMGGKGVRIELGKSMEPAADGALMQSGSEPAMLDGLAAGLGPLMNKVTETLDSLNRTISSVNTLFSPSNQAHFSRTLAHLEKTMSDVSGIASVIEGRSAELDAFVMNLASLSDKMGSVMLKADSAMTGISKTATQISDSDIIGVISSFKELLENINDPDGTIGRLFNDDSLYDSVDSLLNDIDTLVGKIQENPKKYIRISVF